MNKVEKGIILAVIGAIASGALYLGKLDGRVEALEQDKDYKSISQARIEALKAIDTKAKKVEDGFSDYGIKRLSNIVVAPSECEEIESECGLGTYDKTLHYIDRVKFSCPDTKPVMKSFEFARCGILDTGGEGLSVHAKCCGMTLSLRSVTE